MNFMSFEYYFKQNYYYFDYFNETLSEDKKKFYLILYDLENL
jgi:hypothetical protein